MAKKYDLTIGNIFHAGDGNLHPLILFDMRDAEQFERVLAASQDILEFCIQCGGSITGEHGVGMEKRDLMPRAVHRRRSRRHDQPAKCVQRTTSSESGKILSHPAHVPRDHRARAKSGAGAGGAVSATTTATRLAPELRAICGAEHVAEIERIHRASTTRQSKHSRLN